MTLRYLPENVESVRLALDLANKEASHLHYSCATLFALGIDLEWVQALAVRPELAEKVEAFVSRFGRLQDHLGEKLMPRFAALLGDNSRTLLDTLAFAEKANLLSNAEDFIAARRLRNALVHEYMHDAQVFLESLFEAQKACEMFLSIIRKIETELHSREVP
jgi:hypothetical protein